MIFPAGGADGVGKGLEQAFKIFFGFMKACLK